jgi:predicted nucleic acid-binding protein
MPSYVIDTNVCIAANGKDCPQADERCILSCIQALKDCVAILKGEIPGVVVIDEFGEILDEYRKYLSHSGQPGVGDLFFKELFNMQARNTCEKVVINKNVQRGYEEFPDDPDLLRFDPSDRKFVAVAIKSQYAPVILNAVDTDWYEYQKRLSKYVKIKQLCPNCLKRIRRT